MKTLLTTLIATFALHAAIASGDGWITDLPKALEQAKKEKKMVLLDFNGSDWCPPCIQLRKDVFDSDEFKKYAKDNLVLVDVDFPKRKKQDETLAAANEKLSEKYKIEFFPTIIVLDGEGQQLMRDGYGGESPMDYVAKLKKLKK